MKQVNLRVGDSCWYQLKEYLDGKWIYNWHRGVFHGWGCEYEEYESGPGNYTVGIVEDAVTHRCNAVSIAGISFGEDSPAGK
jgi:hypothetical protein